MTKTEAPSFRAKKPSHFSRHPEPGYVVKGRIWLEKDGELYMGWGRIMLLERIDKFGSVAAAAGGAWIILSGARRAHFERFLHRIFILLLD